MAIGDSVLQKLSPVRWSGDPGIPVGTARWLPLSGASELSGGGLARVGDGTGRSTDCVTTLPPVHGWGRARATVTVDVDIVS